ncbi:MAG: sodium-translocating pyrophosphatase [bacterium]|nr:sodium-translocating pyrophosphatase [bacterium]
MITLIVSFIGIMFAFILMKRVLKADPGTPKMVEISKAIQDGASAFMMREFKTISVFTVLMAVILFFVYHNDYRAPLVYIIGTVTSCVAGYIGMKAATSSNARTAQATKRSFHDGLQVAFSGGAVMGFTVVGLGLFMLTILFILFNDPYILLSYAFGASIVALFLRVGGGIFTKSADVGADLVGKVEAGIPEDDPRNPAVIADNVGDNVGDVAGMGSDLFESYASSIVAAMALGAVVYEMKGMILPLLFGIAGILSSIVGTFFVSASNKAGSFAKQTERVRTALNHGMLVSNAIMIVAAFLITWYVFGLEHIGIFYALVTGLVVGFLVGKVTEYYTSDQSSPVKRIAKSATQGAGPNIITGLSSGMMSTVLPVILVALATVFAFTFAGLYGIAIAAVGMLVTLGFVLSTDCYGPIADNAAGIAEMAGMGKSVRRKTEALDAVGNTTAAIGKGFAISSAALAALAWLATFFAVAKIDSLSITSPNVIAGLFIGGMLSFMFCAFTMNSVGKGAAAIVDEVRRQFKSPLILKGKKKPDYNRCIDITTKMALKEMRIPGILLVVIPIVVGLLFGVEALGGLLVGALLTGFLLAVMMSNAGGAWDNAKKYIEAGKFGGKGSEAHKASVIGDTVGDPFKDTSGPSLNILIKLVGKVAVIFIPLFLIMKPLFNI